MDDLKQGLKIEKIWKEVLEKENCYMYHISTANLWIAIQISEAVYNSSILEIKCLFQSCYEDNEMRFYPQKIQSIVFNISSNDLMVYQKIKMNSLTDFDIYLFKEIKNHEKKTVNG
ncbi:hypothetical protein F6Y02_39105 (plasmid) [Bacillus megaterium]|nr:hypothetical protein [Priestia megaterium]